MQEKEISRETLHKIGIIFFTLILLLTLSTVFIIREFVLVKYYPIPVQFNFVADLKKGADVKFIGGVRIGYVKKIYRSGNKIMVLLNIMEDFKVRERADISIFTVGMMGEKFVELDQNENSGGFIASGTSLMGNDALSLEIFQISLAKLTQKTIYAKDVKIPAFQELMNNINQGLRHYLDTIRDKRPGTMGDITSFKENTEVALARVKDFKGFIDRLKVNIRSIDKNDMNELFLGLKELDKDLSSLNLSLENVILISQNLKYETESITGEKNITGKLIFSEEYYRKIEKTMKEWEDFSEKIAEHPNLILSK
ncbi:MAG: MlaD family protein [bacterium]|nr:MlaD family protein [bacterium]